MANVCQKCGAVGFADLLVYCSLCHEAAQHQYCLETVPGLDEDVRWECEDCNLGVVKPKCFEKCQGDDIDLSASLSVHSLEERNGHLVSNENNATSRNHLCHKDLLVQSECGPNLHGDMQKLKGWGKTNKRAMRSKQIAEAYIDPSRNGSASSQPFEYSKPNEGDISMDDIEKESSLGDSFERSHAEGYRRKLILVDEDEDEDEDEDDLIEGTTSHPLDVSRPNAHQRNLMMLDEDNFSRDGIEKDSYLAINHSLEWVRPDGRRRKLVLPDESDDSIDANENDTLSKFVVLELENMISMDQFFEKDDKCFELVRKLILSNGKNGLNGLKTSLLKDLEVGLILEKINEEMIKKSDEDQIDLLVSSLGETNPISKKNDSVLALSNQVNEHNGLEASLLHETNDEMTTKTKCPCDSPKMASHIIGDDGQLQKVAMVSNVCDSTLQSELVNTHARPMSWTCWRGWFKISGRYYGPLIAHWSTKIGEKAWNATRSLPQIVELTMVSRSRAWPKSFDKAPPTDGHIALFFFPQDSRVEKMVDSLLEEVIRCNLMLKVALDEAEMLVLPSVLLPENCQRFQDRYYLWGVCKRKDSDTNTGEVTGIQNTNENSTKQVVPIPVIQSEEVQREVGNEDMHLD